MPASANRKTLRSYRIGCVRSELPAEFLTARPTDQQIQTALDDYVESRSDQDREALAALFLPLITAMAIRRKVRGAPNSEVDDLISDGCLALLNVIRRHSELSVSRFCKYVFGAIRLQFFGGMGERMWAGGKKQHARDNRTMLQLRSMFLKQHGRMPTGVELRAALDRLIENGQIEKDFTRVKMIAASAADGGADEDGVDLLSAVGKDGHVGPLYETINRETMNLALRGLKGIDRTIFKLAIEGTSVDRIAKQVKRSQSYINQKVNVLLWNARVRKDLAAYLGAEPAEAPATRENGKLIPIKQAPPARMVTDAA
jgi:DNA-directed RNA polymerase specialized sigma subunit